MSSLQGRILRSRRFVQGLLLTVSSRDRLKTSPVALHWFPSVPIKSTIFPRGTYLIAPLFRRSAEILSISAADS